MSALRVRGEGQGHLPRPQRRGPEKRLHTIHDTTASAPPSLPDVSARTHVHTPACGTLTHAHMPAHTHMHECTCLRRHVCARTSAESAHPESSAPFTAKVSAGERRPGPPPAPELCSHDANGPQEGRRPLGHPATFSRRKQFNPQVSEPERKSGGRPGCRPPEARPKLVLTCKATAFPTRPFQKVLRSKFKGFDGGAP